MPAVTTAIQKPGSIPLVSNLLTNTGRSAMSGIRLSNLQTSLRIQGSWNMVKCYWSIMISCWEFCTYLQTQAAQHPLNLLQLRCVLPNLVYLPVRDLIGHLTATHGIWREYRGKGKYRNSSSFSHTQLSSLSLKQPAAAMSECWLEVYRLSHVTSNQSGHMSPSCTAVLLLICCFQFFYHIGRHFPSVTT